MAAPEYAFYHLESQPLGVALPLIVEKALARGWRSCVRFSTAGRMDAIDAALWTYRDDSFLAHGTAKDGDPARQPVFLTLRGENANGAQAVFLVEDAHEPSPEAYARVIRMFEDTDDAAKAKAREEWKAAKAYGFDVSYWRQDEAGTWKRF